MKKLNHTPGPWDVLGYTDEDTEFSVYADAKKIDENGRVFQADWIADLCADNTSGGFKTTEANARLISAAPEMLEALILAVKDPVKFSWSTGSIMDIIEKATGYTWDELNAKD